MEKLLEYFNAERGRMKSLADALGITPGAVSQWRNVPPNQLARIEAVTGIPRQQLRPDLYDGMKAAAE
jgi:DNA-binding transcriptional regulator YdaS (Cro superfamily)